MDKYLLAVVVSLFLLCAGIGVVVAVYLWLVWHVSRRDYRSPPPPSKPLKQNGLSEADLRRLPSVECGGGDEEGGGGGGAALAGLECAVCLELLQSGERCRLLPACSHTFHLQCADAWLSKRSLCPICRRSALIINTEQGELRPPQITAIATSIQ